MTEKQAKSKLAKDWVGLQVRINGGLRQQLFDMAASNNVSMNAELVNRLEQSFLRDDGPVDETTAALFQAFRRALTKIEKLTEHRWHNDRACYEAVKASLNAIYSDFLPPFINEEAVLEISNRLRTQNNKITGILDMLLNWGAITEATEPRNALLEKSSIFPSKSGKNLLRRMTASSLTPESQNIYNVLLDLGRYPLVSLDAPAAEWKLMENDQPAPPDVAVGARAMMIGLVRLKGEHDAMTLFFKELYAPTADAARQGKAIAEHMRNTGALSEMMEYD